jgi:hypothetical protein
MCLDTGQDITPPLHGHHSRCAFHQWLSLKPYCLVPRLEASVMYKLLILFPVPSSSFVSYRITYPICAFIYIATSVSFFLSRSRAKCTALFSGATYTLRTVVPYISTYRIGCTTTNLGGQLRRSNTTAAFSGAPPRCCGEGYHSPLSFLCSWEFMCFQEAKIVLLLFPQSCE